ncbi:class I SAM-dependent methyltransferase [Rhodospirillaceae bacterium KN72]|uniref:Class I SAM-dependent methyltransferase n=1 Tax=Pacificispira spongiicola TaxID=2729598 RepID=A0A7Y0DXE0_9PROT|nr:cyclopropane-fatty-acyl-phospholipid synthase family protein [Pacificispira spongiicola]NMM43360.1 class I SAM-dependent methyltransferase [Pacificispira spongiicola]
MEDTFTNLATPNARRTSVAKPSGLREMLLARGLKNIETGRLTVDFPSGARLHVAGKQQGPDAMLSIADNRAVTRLLTAGDLGFAEGYMAGEWDTPDLKVLLDLGLRNEAAFAGSVRRIGALELVNRLRHRLRANSRRGSRRNIAAHYDLGNDFYTPWLDQTMSYSSAIFEDMDEPMEIAQQRKYARMAEMLDLQDGDHILEIGCGWGGFAEYAARNHGCRVTGLTLSHEQARYSRDRMILNGLSDQVEIRLQDYRDVDGRFDKIASIEMFEAVGQAYWPVYFGTLKARLKPGGKAALQSITIADDGFDAYRASPDFIQRYIFPGGMLPSPKVFGEAVAQSGLTLSDSFFFGPSYAETLRRWDRDFTAQWSAIRKLGFDERFRRMWHYYLKYCEVGFDAGRIDVGQFVLER